MSITNMLLPLFFLMFLMIYQASPTTYYQTIDEMFKEINESFQEKFETGFDSQQATFETVISLFLKSVLYSAFAIAVLVVWLAAIIPIPAETLIWIYIAFLIIGNIPWGIILGTGLLVKDWLDKRRKQNEK